jgi:hypothetical protein
MPRIPIEPVWIAACVCVAVWSGTSAAVHADQVDHVDHADASAADATDPAMALGLELGFAKRASMYERTWVVSPLLRASYRFARGFAVGLDWGFVLAHQGSPRDDSSGAGAWTAAQGNPWITLQYRRALSARAQLELRTGLTIPTAWLPRDGVYRSLHREAYALASATRGLWDAWLWAPQHAAFALTANYRHALTAWLDVQLAAGLAVAAELGYLTEDMASVFGQVSPALELRHGPLYAGVAARAVTFAPADDHAQLSALGYVGLRFAQLRVEASGLCNLDEPLGAAGAGLSLCGMWLAGSLAR